MRQLEHSGAQTLEAQSLKETPLARRVFEDSKSCIVYVSALPNDPAADTLFWGAGIHQIWLMCKLRMGAGDGMQEITFDLGVGRHIAVPCSGEDIQVSVRPIGPQISTDLVTMTNQQFTDPPLFDPSGIGGTLNTPVRCQATIATAGKGGSLPPFRVQHVLLPATTFQILPIARGARSVAVFGSSKTASNWNFRSLGAGGLGFNAADNMPPNGPAVEIPPATFGVQVNNLDAAAHQYMIVQYMGT